MRPASLFLRYSLNWKHVSSLFPWLSSSPVNSVGSVVCLWGESSVDSGQPVFHLDVFRCIREMRLPQPATYRLSHQDKTGQILCYANSFTDSVQSFSGVMPPILRSNWECEGGQSQKKQLMKWCITFPWPITVSSLFVCILEFREVTLAFPC